MNSERELQRLPINNLPQNKLCQLKQKPNYFAELRLAYKCMLFWYRIRFSNKSGNCYNKAVLLWSRLLFYSVLETYPLATPTNVQHKPPFSSPANLLARRCILNTSATIAHVALKEYANRTLLAHQVNPHDAP